MQEKTWAEKLLAAADIRIGGDNPWDIQIHDPAVYDRVLTQGSIGLGESYMDGWWSCKNLDQFFNKLFLANIPGHITMSWPALVDYIKVKILNLQKGKRAFEVAYRHYDLGNDFFKAMVGPSLMYSCGYWNNSKDLDSAQFAKMDLICRKLNLKKGQRILEIGSGWGSFAKYAAENYGVAVTGVTVSKEQFKFSKDYCKGLPIEFRLQDYRQIHEKFDHVVSIAMFEAVGLKNFTAYMQVVKRCLKDDGLFLLHTIGLPAPDSQFDPWLNKYIFPNGFVPSLRDIFQASEKLFITEDVHNFGADYDRTLMEWHKNFQLTWPKFEKHYGQKFYRMWEYYLLMCAGLSRSRTTQLWHIVFSQNGVPGGYQSIR